MKKSENKKNKIKFISIDDDKCHDNYYLQMSESLAQTIFGEAINSLPFPHAHN